MIGIRKLRNAAAPVIGVVALLALWQLLVSLHLWEANLLPSPHKVANALRELLAEGTLWQHAGISLYRFFAGYLMAAGVALPLGLLLGWFTASLKVANPVLQLLRPISPIAWFPFIVLWFGIGNAPAIAIITIAAFFPILFSTISAIGKIDAIYLKVSDNFGLSRFRFFCRIAFPLAFPGITVGLHIAIGTAWVFLVAGEMIGAQSGIGYMIIDARNNIRNDMVLAGIILIGTLGWLLDSMAHQLEKTIYKRWGID